MPTCTTPGCINVPAKSREKCETCRSRAYSEKYPARRAFYNLKHRAEERGKEFLLTRVQFEKWCEKTGYHVLKGKHREGMSVDRIDETGPYSIDNIKMMTLGENSSKAHAHNGHNSSWAPQVATAGEPEY